MPLPHQHLPVHAAWSRFCLRPAESPKTVRHQFSPVRGTARQSPDASLTWYQRFGYHRFQSSDFNIFRARTFDIANDVITYVFFHEAVLVSLARRFIDFHQRP